jgi:hypothetical protein
LFAGGAVAWAWQSEDEKRTRAICAKHEHFMCSSPALNKRRRVKFSALLKIPWVRRRIGAFPFCGGYYVEIEAAGNVLAEIQSRRKRKVAMPGQIVCTTFKR